MQRLQNDLSSINNNLNSRTAVELSYEEIQSEVGDFEGALADHKIAVEKCKHGNDPSKIFNYLQELKLNNNTTAHDLDQIFITSQIDSKESDRMIEELETSHLNISRHLSMCDTNRLKAYGGLMNEGKSLDFEIVHFRDQVSHLSQSASHNDKVRRMEHRQNSLMKIEQLHDEIFLLNEELKISEMESKEAHVYLLEKVKSDHEYTNNLDTKNKSIILDIFHFEDNEQNQSNAGKEDDSLAAEYERVAIKEIPRDSFLEVSESDLRALYDNHFHNNTIIYQMLEDKFWNIGVSHHSELPTKKYQKLKEKIRFQTKHLLTSTLTKELLNKERNKTIDELELLKKAVADPVIEVEKLELAAKSAKIMEENYIVNDLNLLRQKANSTYNNLLNTIDRFREQINAFDSKSEGQLLSDHKDRKERLQRNDTWISFLKLDDKLRFQKQTVFSVQESIHTKEYVDYKSIKPNCNYLVAELNQALSYQLQAYGRGQ